MNDYGQIGIVALIILFLTVSAMFSKTREDYQRFFLVISILLGMVIF